MQVYYDRLVAAGRAVRRTQITDRTLDTVQSRPSYLYSRDRFDGAIEDLKAALARRQLGDPSNCSSTAHSAKSEHQPITINPLLAMNATTTLVIELDYQAPELRQVHHCEVAGLIAGTDAEWINFDPEHTPGGFQVDRIAIPRSQFADLYQRIQALSYGVLITELYRA